MASGFVPRVPASSSLAACAGVAARVEYVRGEWKCACAECGAWILTGEVRVGIASHTSPAPVSASKWLWCHIDCMRKSHVDALLGNLPPTRHALVARLSGLLTLLPADQQRVFKLVQVLTGRIALTQHAAAGTPPSTSTSSALSSANPTHSSVSHSSRCSAPVPVPVSVPVPTLSSHSHYLFGSHPSATAAPAAPSTASSAAGMSATRNPFCHKRSRGGEGGRGAQRFDDDSPSPFIGTFSEHEGFEDSMDGASPVIHHKPSDISSGTSSSSSSSSSAHRHKRRAVGPVGHWFADGFVTNAPPCSRSAEFDDIDDDSDAFCNHSADVELDVDEADGRMTGECPHSIDSDRRRLARSHSLAHLDGMGVEELFDLPIHGTSRATPAHGAHLRDGRDANSTTSYGAPPDNRPSSATFSAVLQQHSTPTTPSWFSRDHDRASPSPLVAHSDSHSIWHAQQSHPHPHQLHHQQQLHYQQQLQHQQLQHQQLQHQQLHHQQQLQHQQHLQHQQQLQYQQQLHHQQYQQHQHEHPDVSFLQQQTHQAVPSRPFLRPQALSRRSATPTSHFGSFLM